MNTTRKISGPVTTAAAAVVIALAAPAASATPASSALSAPKAATSSASIANSPIATSSITTGSLQAARLRAALSPQVITALSTRLQAGGADAATLTPVLAARVAASTCGPTEQRLACRAAHRTERR